MQPSAHSELNDKLNTAIEANIENKLGGCLDHHTPERKALIMQSHTNNAHIAGAIKSGYLNVGDVINGDYIARSAESKFPVAVGLAKDLYDHRNEGTDDRQIMRQMHGQLMGGLPTTVNSASLTMAEIANKHSQIPDRPGNWDAVSVMAHVLNKTKAARV